MRIGLLLPHFGRASNRERLFDHGSRLGDFGFGSAWVRDQLGFRGLGFEGRQAHFVDPFITLAAIAARSGITVGTATLTPIRPPVVTAQLVASLAYLAEGRLVLGVGLGGQPRAFELAGLRYTDRVAHFEDMIGVLRATSTANASFEGRFTRFESLTLDPPVPADLPIWYCGTSPAAISRALRFADGWFPGRCPFVVFDGLLARLREGAASSRSMAVGIVPLLSPGRDRADGLGRIDVDGLLEEARGKPGWGVPFRSADDLRGALIAGGPDEIGAELEEFQARGVDEVVLDLRQRMDVFEDTLESLARHVLPSFRSAGPRPAAARAD